MKKVFIYLVLCFLYSNFLIAQNYLEVVYEAEEQYKPIIMKAIDMIGKNGALTDGYIITMPSLLSPNSEVSTNDLITPEYLKIGKDYRIEFDGDKTQAGTQSFSFKQRQLTNCQTNDKYIFVIEDAVRTVKDIIIACGRIDIYEDGKTKNYAGFAININIANLNTGADDLILFHNTMSVNSVVLVNDNSWIFCGTTKPGTVENGTNGIIFRITANPPYNCGDYKQNWAYILHSNPTDGVASKIWNTSLHKIKYLGLEGLTDPSRKVYGVIGTTNENIFEADMLFVTINEDGKISYSDIWGRKYDIKNRKSYKEYGKSFASRKNQLYALGRYIEENNPDNNPTVIYDDFYVANLERLSQDYHYVNLNWSNRYDVYSSKSFPDIPEDILITSYGRVFISILGNCKLSSTNYNAFIMDLIESGNFYDLTIFGDDKDGIDLLYTFTHSYSNSLVAAGVTNTFSNLNSTGTKSDLWVVENVFQDNDDSCDYVQKDAPGQQKISLERTRSNISKFQLEMSCCRLKLFDESAKDEIICGEGSTPVPDSCHCKDLMKIKETKNNFSGIDTCSYDVVVSVDTCKNGYQSLINGIIFEEVNGNEIFVQDPGNWTFLPDLSDINKWVYTYPNGIPPGDYNFFIGFFKTNGSCRKIAVHYGDFSDPDVPIILCCDTIELCCPPCPILGDVSIKCDSLLRGTYPIYEICADIVYYGTLTDIFVAVSGPGISGFQVDQLSTPGTICFQFIDWQHLPPGTPILIESYMEDANGDKICVNSQVIEIPDCCPDYSNLKVQCDEMTNDGQSYIISLDITNNWDSPVQVFFNSYPPAINQNPVTVNPGLNHVNINYVDMAGIGAGGVVNVNAFIIFNKDTMCYYNEYFELPDCPSTDCSIFINKDSCCCYEIKAINPTGKKLQQAILNVSGGQAIKFNNYDGCSSTSTPMPSSTVTWDYSPTCDQMFWNYVCFQSDNASGDIITNWTFVYTDGSKCNITDTIRCNPLSEMRCDMLSYYPIPDIKEQEEIIHFVIQNNKVPQSPICSVIVEYNPTTMITSGDAPTSGGFFVIDEMPTGTGDDARWRAPYQQLLVHGDPNYPSNDPIVNFGHSIGFNIGMNYYNGFNGTIKFKVKHCDGKICEMTFDWATHDPDSVNSEYTLKKGDIILDSLYFFILDEEPVEEKKPTEEVSWWTVAWIILTSTTDKNGNDNPLEVQNFKLEAITGSVVNNGEAYETEYEITRQSSNSATFKLVKPRLLSKELPLKCNLLFSGKLPDDFYIVSTLFNNKAQVISQDSSKMVVSKVIDDGQNDGAFSSIQLGKSFPNPSLNEITIDYYLSRSELISIDLLDLNGKKIKSIDEVFAIEGKNSITFNTYDIQSGDYFVRFRTSDGKEVIRKVIIIK